jgi:hypothetical protein
MRHTVVYVNDSALMLDDVKRGGDGHTPSRAWRAARMNLFRASISGILSEIPAVEK